ncbi:MAG: fumarate hydratase [Methanothrix sp.]|nr:fumarate hydratase [Methanothrix sp.]MDD4447168.1 fumarate hydratase [Methanothrix sp.]
MRDRVVQATVRALQRAETTLPPWVLQKIQEAADRERQPLARQHLQFMLENVAVATAKGLPLCQDTGLTIFHVKIGRDLPLDFCLSEAIAEGVRIATEKIPLRPNAVHPLTRKNSGDNTGPGMPDIILDYVDGIGLSLTAFPKGAGSENMSLVGMLNPADDPFDFIVKTVAKRAANACPPLFLGIGLGGSFDLAARLAKRALLNMPGNSQEEQELLERINSLGIGPMGLGGDTTALGIKIETAFCHTASLPVAINFQCWANRSATEIIQ